jgi:hypothetical protein
VDTGVLLAIVAGFLVVTIVRDDESSSTADLSPELEAAVAVAAVDDQVAGRRDVAEMIQALCTARDGEALGARIVELGVEGEQEAVEQIEAVGRGAAPYCPEVPAADPQLLNDAYRAAIALLREGAG